MKAINTFLLVIIGIGVFAFATQGFWVPRLVERIIASENTAPVLVEATEPKE
ncbi:MAG: hypothetical protein M3Q34_02290 [bacterium]|nr:hypothetical protein [bacterium]